MDEALLALRCGRLSPDAFFKRTKSNWASIAEHLLRRWKGPVAVSAEDIAQELYINAWIFCGHWDPAAGVTISRYVTFNAIDKAKKWLHQQRNAYRRDDKAAPRMERPVSTLNLSEYAEEHLFDSLATAANQEDDLISRQDRRYQLLFRALEAPPQHVPAMVALARTGDLELAALELHSSVPACVVLNLQSLDDARLAVSRALHAAV